MIRQSKHKGEVSAILCSDFHLREDTPICRTDNYWEAQWKKVDFISKLQKKYNCLVLNAGDLFDHWKPSPNLLSETIKHLPKQFFTIYGQHDLPQHSLELSYKSGIETLYNAGKISILNECHWGQTPKSGSMQFQGRDTTSTILVQHITTYVGKLPFEGTPAYKILEKWKDFDLILTGDNHKAFTCELDDRLLVNPGSMMRMAADQVDFEPRIYLWYVESNTVEPVYLPIAEGVISREHIERVEKRNERIEAFISRLDTDYDITLSFEDNLEQFIQVNNIKQEVQNIIFKSIEQ